MAKGVCTIPGCDRFVNGRGLCKTHYMEWYRENKKSEVPQRMQRKEKVTLHGITPDYSPETYWLWVKKELKLS